MSQQMTSFVQNILQTTKDSELIQSYVRGDETEDDYEKEDIAVTTAKSKMIKQNSAAVLPSISTGPFSGSLLAAPKRDIYTPADRRQETSTMSEKQLTSISVKSDQDGGKQKRSTSRQSQYEKDVRRTTVKSVKSKKGRRKKKRTLRNEEIYTDKDRAAAVNMGSKDIKHSLSVKRKEERSKALQIPEEADPGTFLALGNREMHIGGDVSIAVEFVNKALEMNPEDKEALVARSQCFILLGEPQKALDDAETAIGLDKNFINGIYQKAESLYFLGRFEHSLMYYHRGLRIRPELEKFRLGVQKAQEAIENMIGSSIKLGAGITDRKRRPRSRQGIPKIDSVKSKLDVNKNTMSPISDTSANFLPKTPSPIDKSDKTQNGKKRVKKLKHKKSMGVLDVDKEYFEKLIHHPDIKCLDKENSSIVAKAQEAVTYLNNRKEFWRQQLPAPSNITAKKSGSAIISHR